MRTCGLSFRRLSQMTSSASWSRKEKRNNK
jgi:hypothetical protein